MTNKSGAANMAQQARRSSASIKRDKKRRDLGLSEGHEHEWKDWTAGQYQGRECLSCQFNQVLGASGEYT